MSIREKQAWQQHIQTVAKDSSRSREREPFISETFVGLNKSWTERSIDLVLIGYKLRMNKTIAVVYNCIGQAVIVLIIVVSVKFEVFAYKRIMKRV